MSRKCHYFVYFSLPRKSSKSEGNGKKDAPVEEADQTFKIKNCVIENFKFREGSLIPQAKTKDGFRIVSLNGNVTFHAVSRTRRALHDVEKYGENYCQFFPSCKNKLKGGEDIGMAVIVDPVYHPSHGSVITMLLPA